MNFTKNFVALHYEALNMLHTDYAEEGYELYLERSALTADEYEAANAPILKILGSLERALFND